MGLDMYAYSRAGKIDQEVDFEYEKTDVEFYYWRKHPNLHGWMKELYRSKGGTSESFNCDNMVLTLNDLFDLEISVDNNALPKTSGFFFGESSEEDKKDDLEFIEKARAEIAKGRTIYYTSSW